MMATRSATSFWNVEHARRFLRSANTPIAVKLSSELQRANQS
jgi:hypothetical protein